MDENTKKRMAAANLAQLTYRIDMVDDEPLLSANLPFKEKDMQSCWYQDDLKDSGFSHSSTHIMNTQNSEGEGNAILRISGEKDVVLAGKLGIAADLVEAWKPDFNQAPEPSDSLSDEFKP